MWSRRDGGGQVVNERSDVVSEGGMYMSCCGPGSHGGRE